MSNNNDDDGVVEYIISNDDDDDTSVIGSVEGEPGGELFSESHPRKCMKRKGKGGFDCSGFSKGFKQGFRQLKESPRDLLAIYAITFTDSLAYFAFSYALILHLGHEVGLSDELAGVFYGLFGVSISIMTLGLGFVADRLRLWRSMALSSGIGVISRIAMAYAVLSGYVWLSAILLFIFVSSSIALMAPVIPTAVKRYTTTKTIGIGFSLYYGVMNVAAFVASPAVDALRLSLSADRTIMGLPPYALLIAITGLLNIPTLIISLLWVRDIDLQEDGTLAPPPPIKRGIQQRVRLMLKERNFWRAVVIAAVLIGVKSTFRYFDALYLPYVLRSFANADTFPYMSLLSINPAIVITVTLTAAVTCITGNIHPVTSLIIGSLIGGLAPFWMAFGPYVSVIIMYIIFTSIGEVIWSPVAYEYLTLLAGDGEEGAWMAVAGMPLFMAKFLTGTMTGGLMGHFCPDPHKMIPPGSLPNATIAPPPPAQMGGSPQCKSSAIWGIIGSTTITSFFLLLAVRKFITVPMDELKNKTTHTDGRLDSLINNNNEGIFEIGDDDDVDADDMIEMGPITNEITSDFN